MSVGPGAWQRAHLVHRQPSLRCHGSPPVPPVWEWGAAVLGGAVTREELPKQKYRPGTALNIAKKRGHALICLGYAGLPGMLQRVLATWAATRVLGSARFCVQRCLSN